MVPGATPGGICNQLRDEMTWNLLIRMTPLGRRSPGLGDDKRKFGSWIPLADPCFEGGGTTYHEGGRVFGEMLITGGYTRGYGTEQVHLCHTK